MKSGFWKTCGAYAGARFRRQGPAENRHGNPALKKPFRCPKKIIPCFETFSACPKASRDCLEALARNPNWFAGCLETYAEGLKAFGECPEGVPRFHKLTEQLPRAFAGNVPKTR